MGLSRRTFVKSAASTAALFSAGPLPLLAQAAENAAAPSAREPLRELAYADVRLTGGPLKQQYDSLHAHYLALDNDRLLKVYRQRAGLPAPGADMGGWYDLNGFVPGHTLGQYISGVARIGASTGDAACHDKVHDLVSGFAATLGADNQSILRPQTNLWICYTLDKHFIGLIDASTLSNVTESKELLNRVLAGSKTLLPVKGRDRIGKKDPPYDETFVMPENLLTAYDLTGNPEFRELALRYLLDREFFEPLARGEDPFPGQHAYSHAIALSSGGKAYLSLGDGKHKQALQNAFTLLTTQQQFASGGWGPDETFITPHKGELYKALSTTVDHFETPCGAYAATKLARYLIRTSEDSRLTAQYGDNLERVLFNTILAVKSPDSNGDYPYYSTYSPSAEKVYYKKKWPCCSGTLVQTVADYPLNIYFQNAAKNTVYVNLYTPSTASLTVDNVPVHIMQETSYPAEDTATLHLQPVHPIRFAMNLRIPAWLAQPATVAVNGKAVTVSARPGTFATLDRVWHPRDSITLTLPQQFRTEAIDDRHPETVALMRGPVQYVALNPAPGFGSDPLSLPASLKPAGVQTFTENYSGRQIVFVPLHHIQNETYTTYFLKGLTTYLAELCVLEEETHMIASDDRFYATYWIETAFPLDLAAATMAGEQSTGTFLRIPGETDELRELYAARVESIVELEPATVPSLPGSGTPKGWDHVRRTAEVTLSWPLHNIGPSLPNLLATIAGNLSELKAFSGLKLLDVVLPRAFLAAYQGPQFGVEGTRDFTGVYGRPLIGTIIKPSIGQTAAVTAAQVKVLAEAGIDFIKDDELQSDGPHCTFNDRVTAVQDVLNNYAALTGKRVMYAANITGDLDEMLARLAHIKASGGTCAMVSMNSIGLPAMKIVRKHAKVVIHGHRNGWGMLGRSPAIGMSFIAFQKLWRLAGIDHTHVNGLRNKFCESDASVVASARACLTPMFAPPARGCEIIPVFSSGQSARQVPDTYKALGCNDLIYACGGGIMGHPMGVAAGVRSLQQAWEAAAEDIPLEAYASTHPELKAALTMFGA